MSHSYCHLFSCFRDTSYYVGLAMAWPGDHCWLSDFLDKGGVWSSAIRRFVQQAFPTAECSGRKMKVKVRSCQNWTQSSDSLWIQAGRSAIAETLTYCTIRIPRVVLLSLNLNHHVSTTWNQLPQPGWLHVCRYRVLFGNALLHGMVQEISNRLPSS